MTTATHTNLTMTLEAFLRMPGNEHYQWMHGEAIPMAESPNRHAWMISLINFHLLSYVRTHPMGAVFSESAHYRVTLADGTQAIRKPDVGFMAAENPQTLWDIHPFEGGPDLAVEVTSDWDRASDVDEKVQLWLNNDSRMVWVVYHQREVTVHRPGNAPITLDKNAQLDGENVLPGFSVAVSEFFK